MICSKTGCINPARFRVILLLWPKNLVVENPTRLLLPVNVCYFCKDTLMVSNVISDQGWINIIKKFQENNVPIPDRSTLKLEFIEL